MKLTRKDRAYLENILYHVKRAEKFIMDKKTHVCIETKSCASHDGVFSNDKVVVLSIQKEYGSDLCGLYFAIRGLETILGNTEDQQ